MLHTSAHGSSSQQPKSGHARQKVTYSRRTCRDRMLANQVAAPPVIGVKPFGAAPNRIAWTTQCAVLSSSAVSDQDIPAASRAALVWLKGTPKICEYIAAASRSAYLVAMECESKSTGGREGKRFGAGIGGRAGGRERDVDGRV